MLLDRKYVSFIFFFSCFITSGQKTNVILPSLIEIEDHKTCIFNNGENLVKIFENNDEDYVNWKKNVNKPAVFILKSGGYLYNIRALNNSKNICPQGKHVLLKKDILDQNDSRVLINGSILRQEILTFTPSCIEPAYFTKEMGFFLATGDPQFFEKEWSIELNKFDSLPHFLMFNFKGNEELTFSTSSGGPTRCVYNSYDELFRQEIFQCKTLMPDQLLSFKKSLKEKYALEPKLGKVTDVELVWVNENGITSFFELKKNILPEVKDNIISLLLTKIPKPFYSNVDIQTKDTIVFSIVPNSELNSKSYLTQLVINRSLGFNKYSPNERLNSLLNSSLEFGAKAVLKRPNNLVLFSGINNYNENTNSIKKVICPGPIYAIGSIIPGLGVLRFQNSISDKHSNPSKKLLISSLTIAGIGIASKFTSIYQYNKFLNSHILPSDKLNSYKFANATQKVFVVSSAIYGALFLVDFSWTISLGIKSKHVQYQTNSELRKMHKKGIWI